MKSNWRGLLVPAIVVVAALFFLQRFRGGGGSGVAPVPAVFSQGLTLAQAQDQSKLAGKPMLVYATADWCGPCQHFKRTTLLDPEVVAFIQSSTIPVYLDIDHHKEDAAKFNITSIPATVLVRDGSMVAKFSAGAVGANEYLAWLKTEIAAK